MKALLWQLAWLCGLITVSCGGPKDQEGHFENSIGMQFQEVKPGILLSKFPTRVADFEQFVEDTGYEPAKPITSFSKKWGQFGHSWKKPGFPQSHQHPVIGITFVDCDAFCEWLTKKERITERISESAVYRLPTVSEWLAGLGKIPKEEEGTPIWETSDFPWGRKWPPPSEIGNLAGEEAAGKTFGNIEGYSDSYVFTSPVGSFPPNTNGIYDMIGNVMEITVDDEKERGMLCGSGWNSGRRTACRVGMMDDYDDTRGNITIGFRCVLEKHSPIEEQNKSE